MTARESADVRKKIKKLSEYGARTVDKNGGACYNDRNK